MEVTPQDSYMHSWTDSYMKVEQKDGYKVKEVQLHGWKSVHKILHA